MASFDSALGPGVLDVPSADVGLDVKFGFNDLCPVCGDKVSGFHYGLLTCESCKGKNLVVVVMKRNRPSHPSARLQAFLNEQYRTRRIINVLINNNVKSTRRNGNAARSVGSRNAYKWA